MTDYFRRVQEQTPTQFFCEGIQTHELKRAIEWGAVGATCNPPRVTYAIRSESDYWSPETKRILKDNPGLPDEELADIITQKAVGRAAELLRPVFERTGHEKGYQAIQGNPYAYTDPMVLMSSARRYSQIAPNIAVKIPIHQEGLVLIEELAREGVNIICTAGFSVSQCIAAAEACERGVKEAEKRGVVGRCFVVIITGRLDTHLHEQVVEQKIDIPKEWIDWAGVIVTKKIYRLFKERNFSSLLLSAGGRGPHHFTEFVGGDMIASLTLQVREKLAVENGQVIIRIDDLPPAEIIAELRQKLPDFRRAYEEDGLGISEMRSFGPCLKIEQYFLEGFDDLLKFICSEK
jgi:transaldolase